MTSVDLVPTLEEKSELTRLSPEWRDLATRWQLAKALADPLNNVCPDAYRGKPGAIFQVLQMGHELGLAPTQALLHINFIEGRASLDAQLMRALVYRAGHDITYVERSSSVCIIRGKRHDTGAELEVAWSIEDADNIEQGKGKLREKSNWKNYPRAMLDARATTELVRALFPDVIGWAAYDPEEVGSEDIGLASPYSEGEGGPAEVEASPTKVPRQPETLLP